MADFQRLTDESKAPDGVSPTAGILAGSSNGNGTARHSTSDDDLTSSICAYDRKSSASVASLTGAVPNGNGVTHRNSIEVTSGTADVKLSAAAKAAAERDVRDRPMTEEEKKRALQRFSLGRLLEQSKPERPLLIWATFCLFISSITSLAMPALMGVIIDAISSGANGQNEVTSSALTDQLARLAGSNTPKAVLNASVVVLAVLILVGAIFSFARGYAFMLAGQKVVARLRKKLFAAILVREISFFDVTRTGELVNRLAADTTELKDAVTSNMSMALRWTATFVGGLIYLFLLSWKLTFVMLSVVPIVAFAGQWYGAKMRINAKATQQALAEATTVAEESIGNIRTVRSFYREPFQQSLYDERVDETYRLGAYQALLYGAFIGGITFVASAALILVLWYGATLVLSGELTPGLLTSFLLYTLTIGFALGGLSDLFGTMMKAVGANERVFELIDTPPLINIKDGLQLSPFDGRVTFEEVAFKYPSRPTIDVLKDVSFDLRPGTVTALVGPSGGGKSTIVSVIERFYDVTGGRVLIDGKDVRDIDPAWLHRHIGLVSQEPVLFATSLRANLTYGVESATDEEIKRACEMANAHEFISTFADGYDTMVGERGIRLSGGQKQRVAIARAILMNPRILIADEATSALDAESEYHVQQALDRLMKGRTVLVVAHRLSTVKMADAVLVIDGGRIVETGTHDQLLKRSGIYAKLVRRQLTGDSRDPATIAAAKSGTALTPVSENSPKASAAAASLSGSASSVSVSTNGKPVVVHVPIAGAPPPLPQLEVRIDK